MRLPELLALIPVKLSRRSAPLGLSAAIAAPFAIPTPGNLMPVRNRIITAAVDDGSHSLFLNWQKYPPSVEEVRKWRASMATSFSLG